MFAVLAMQGRELLEDGVDAVVVAHDDDVPVLHHGRVAPRPQLFQPSLRKNNNRISGLRVSLLFRLRIPIKLNSTAVFRWCRYA